MALPPYPSLGDAGVLFVIIANTIIYLSIVKGLICSGLSSVGIRFPSWGEEEILVDSSGCLRATSDVFVDEFRSQVPAIPYKSIPTLDRPAQDCSICLNEFNRNARVNRLSCGHVFHKSCLEEWLSYWKPTCPLCRNDMMTKDAKEEDDCTPM
ncbi:probable E3 ubiquitin-protein ligase xerico [Phtheirospermum japonicum]|uniref:Probable E3 ubiquitin-protein ligase xerico n=1 Tax=Phtheirospermum japonicum TaxID=374723 RepID=A0A830BX10_9LAMI|nr:probable E3 ubiquitin-protein ligase xerico [Phtheirospermum japonicum]